MSFHAKPFQTRLRGSAILIVYGAFGPTGYLCLSQVILPSVTCDKLNVAFQYIYKLWACYQVKRCDCIHFVDFQIGADILHGANGYLKSNVHGSNFHKNDL